MPWAFEHRSFSSSGTRHFGRYARGKISVSITQNRNREGWGEDRVELTATPNEEGSGLVLEMPEPLRRVRARPLSFTDRLLGWHPSVDGKGEFIVMPLGQMTYSDLAAAVRWQRGHTSPSLLGQSVRWLWEMAADLLMDDPSVTVESIKDSQGNGVLDLGFDPVLNA